MLDSHKRLLTIFADASEMHAEAASVLPLKSQIVWGFFRMGADLITAPANNNQVNAKEFVAKAFQENCNEAVYGVTPTMTDTRKQSKRDAFRQQSAKIVTMPVSANLFADHGREMGAHVITMLPDIIISSIEPTSDSFDSKIVDFKKYKQDHLKFSA